MVKKIKSIRAWAIVNKDKPSIDCDLLCEKKDDYILQKFEKLIRVEISVVK